MSNPNPVDHRTLLFDIALKPAVAHLPSPAFHERRNLAAREALMRRVRAEFTEVPGLSLTVRQGMKLLNLSEAVALRIFAELVREDVLGLTTDGRYTPRTTWP